MLNPVVMLPLPAALAVIGLLAYAALRYTEHWPTYPTWRPSAPPRHRLASTAEPYRPRPWAEIAADLPTGPAPAYVPYIPGPDGVFDPLDHRIPLAEVERRMQLPQLRAAYMTLELPAAPVEIAGLDTWAADTHELAAV